MAKRKDIHRPAAIEPADYFFVAHDYCRPGQHVATMSLSGERAGVQARAHGPDRRQVLGPRSRRLLPRLRLPVNAMYSSPSSGTSRAIQQLHRDRRRLRRQDARMGEPASKRSVSSATRSPVRRKAIAGKRKARAALEEAGMGEAWAIFESRKKANGLSSDEELIVAGHHFQAGALWLDLGQSRWPSSAGCWKKIAKAPEIAAAGLRERRWKRQTRKSPVPVVEGRVLVKGEVLTIKTQEGFYGVQTKMLVKCEAGFKLWGSCPSSIIDQVERGSVVEFNASVKPSDDDKSFGFFSRPSKAKLIKALAA